MSDATPAPENTELRSEIKHALNRASAENESGTPDHILADFLLASLAAFDAALIARTEWRGESVELPALQRLRSESDHGDHGTSDGEARVGM